MASILFKIVRISNSQFKSNYLKNKTVFFNFWFNFWNLHQIWNKLREKMMVIANLFPKLETVENLIRTLSKKPRFRTRFDSQHLKVCQILAKSPWELFYHVFHHSQGSWFWKCIPKNYVKSSRCWLTHWLPMRNILFKIVRIFHYHLECSYLRNQKIFLNLLLHF